MNDEHERYVRCLTTLSHIRELFHIPQGVATLDFLTGFLRETCKHTIRDVYGQRTTCRNCGKVEPMIIPCTCGDCEQPKSQHQQVLEEDGAAQTLEITRNDRDYWEEQARAIDKERAKYKAMWEAAARESKDLARQRDQNAELNRDVDERVRQEVQHAQDVMGQELNKLRDFKQRVHDMLDDRDIPKFEDEDCRVAHRLGAVFNTIKILRERLRMIKRSTEGI